MRRRLTGRWRLAARIGGRIVLGVLLLLVAVLVGIAITLQTTWGREQVRKQAQAALSEMFVGEVHIGSISSNPLALIAVDDLTIADASGQMAIKVGALRIDYNLWPLLTKRVVLESVEISQLQINLRHDSQGAVNLTSLMRPSEPSSGTFDWDIVVKTLSVEGRVDGLGVPLQSVGLGAEQLRFDKRGASLENFRAYANDSTVSIPQLAWDTLTKTPEMAVNATLQPRFLALVGPQFPALDDALVVEIATARPQPNQPLSLSLQVRSGLQEIRTSVELDVSAGLARGKVQVEHLDIGTFTGEPGASNLNGTVTFGLRGTEVATAQGDVEVQLSGVAFQKTIQQAHLKANLRDAVASLQGAVQLAGMEMMASGVVELGQTPRVRSSQLVVDIAKLATLEDWAPGLKGMMHLAVKASGTLNSATASVLLDGENIEVRGHSIGPVHADMQWVRDGDTFEVDTGTAQLGPVSLSATAKYGPGILAVDIAELRVKLAKLRGLFGDGLGLGGSAVLQGTFQRRDGIASAGLRLNAKRLAIHPAITPLTISGQFDLAQGTVRAGLTGSGHRRQRVSVSASATVPEDPLDSLAWQSVDLAAVSRLVVSFARIDLAGPARVLGVGNLQTGIANGRLALSRGSHATVQLSLANLRVPEVHDEVVSASLRGTLVPGALQVKVESDLGSLGQFDATIDSRTPKQPLSPAAWQWRGPQLLRSADIRFREMRVSPETFSNLGIAAPLTAQISGALHIDGDHSGTLLIAASQIASESILGPASAEMNLVLRSGRAELTTSILAPQTFNLRVDAVADVPAHLFEIAAWRSADRRWLQSGRIRADAPLSSPGFAALGRSFHRSGQLQVTGTVGVGMDDAQLDATLRIPSQPGFVQPLQTRTAISIQPAQTTSELQLQLGPQVVANLDATISAGSAQLWHPRPVQLGNTAIVADMKLLDVPIGTVARLLGQTDPLVGQLNGTLSARGVVSKPILTVQLASTDVAFRGSTLPALAVEGRLGSERAEVQIATVNSSGALSGKALQGTATLVNPLSENAVVTANLDVNDLPLHPLSIWVPGLVGTLNATVHAQGPVKDVAVTGQFRGQGLGVRSVGPIWFLRDGEVEGTLTSSELRGTGSAKSGSGRLGFEMVAQHKAFQLLDARAEIRTDALPLRSGALRFSVTTQTEVQAKSDDTGNITADIDVGDTVIVIPNIAGSDSLHPIGALEDVQIVSAQSDPDAGQVDAPVPVGGARWLVGRIKAANTILVRSPEGQASFSADLRMRVAQELALVGAARSNTGKLEIMGRRYDIDRVVVSFSGDPADPTIDVRLVHEFSSFSMGIELSGSVAKPKLLLTADPSIYDQSQLLMFVLGTDPDANQANDPGLTQKATGAVAGLLSGQVMSLVGDRLPIDVLRLDMGEDSVEAAKLTVGKWITNQFFLAYRHRFEANPEDNNQEAVLEYWFWNRYLLEAYFGDQGAAGADVLWIKRF